MSMEWIDKSQDLIGRDSPTACRSRIITALTVLVSTTLASQVSRFKEISCRTNLEYRLLYNIANAV